MLRSRLHDDISIDPGSSVEVVGKSTPVLRNGAFDLNLDFSILNQFTAQHQQEMDDADSELESRAEPVHHPVR